MDVQASRADEACRIEPVYLFWNGEIMLDAPVRIAWPHVINYPSWQNYSSVQHISGPVEQEGEVVLLRKEEAGFEFPAYYARTLKLEPERRVVWKTYPQHAAPGNDFFGIVEFRLYEEQPKTRFCYNTLYEFQVPHRHVSELEVFRTQQYENFGRLFDAILPKLKKMVAESV